VLVGLVLARLTPLPVPLGAMLFLVVTWSVCRAGIQVGYRAQALATWALLLGLGALSLGPLAAAAARGELAARLLPPAPGALGFLAGAGQALFLFMGFDLIAAQAEVAAPGAVGRALGASVGILAAFYTLVSLGFSCLSTRPGTPAGFVPQLALAEEAGGTAALLAIAALTLLASFTSFNGALLSLSRFVYALASQGALPRNLARLDTATLVPRPAVDALLVLAVGATALALAAGGLAPSILAAAVAAALMYAAAMLVRQRPPFAEPDRSRGARALGGALALALAAFGIAVVADAGAARAGLLALLALAYGSAALLAARAGRRTRRPAAHLAIPVGAHGD
jgi:amino acid transporter